MRERVFFFVYFLTKYYRRQLQNIKTVLVLIQRSQIEQNYLNKWTFLWRCFFFIRVYFYLLFSFFLIANNQADFIFLFLLLCVVMRLFFLLFTHVLVLVDFFCCCCYCWNMFELNYYNAFFSFCCLLRCCHSGTRHCCCVLIVLEFKTQCCSLSSKYSHNYFFKQIIRKTGQLVNLSFKNVYNRALCDCHFEAPEIMLIDFWWLRLFFLFSFYRSLAQCYIVLHLPF